MCVVVVVVEEGEGCETNRTMSQLIPSAVSLRIAETEQLYQAMRMMEESATCCSLDLFSN